MFSIMKYKNTIHEGTVRVILFKEDNTWYGVALELNIVESGSRKNEVWTELQEAIRGYIKSAKKANAPDYVLNQTPMKEYERMWSATIKTKNTVNKTRKNKSIKSPFVSFAGAINLESAV